MGYLVNATLRAEQDLAAIFVAINAEYSDTAFRWFNGLDRVILTLEENPERCPVTPGDANLRHLLHGKKPHIYRVIYRILHKRSEVEILHIRHRARRPFEPNDLIAQE
jgi:toxin ParE1/3/4